MAIPQYGAAHYNDSKIKMYFLATRPMFFTASILPILLGSAIGVQISGYVDWYALILAMVTVVCIHGGVNVYNDVHDDLNGTDRINTDKIPPFTGGSGFIQKGLLDIEQMRHWAMALLTSGIILGLMLIVHKGIALIWFGLAGVALGMAYSAPPLKLASRGLGESAVALGFGVLTVVGAAWLQSDELSLHVLLISLSVSLWVANILLINEVPDMVADDIAGKRTLVVRFNLPVIALLYLILNIIAFVFLVLAVWLGYLNVYALILSGVLLIPAVYAAKGIYQWKDNAELLIKGIKITLAIHAVNIIWLTGWSLAG